MTVNFVIQQSDFNLHKTGLGTRKFLAGFFSKIFKEYTPYFWALIFPFHITDYHERTKGCRRLIERVMEKGQILHIACRSHDFH